MRTLNLYPKMYLSCLEEDVKAYTLTINFAFQMVQLNESYSLKTIHQYTVDMRGTEK